jgi:drug/metabolite transporter (DMT)-like permease
MHWDEQMKYRIWIALIALYISWGLTYLAIRFTVETMPPFLMVAVRFLIAGGILYGVRRAIGDPAPARIEWRSAAVIALFLLIGGNGGLTWAEQYVPSGIAALLVGTAPLWMALFDALRPTGRKPQFLTWLGLFLGFAGIVLLIGPSNLNGELGGMNLIGVMVLLLAAVSWAIGSLYNRDATLPDSPLLGTGMEMLAGSAGFFILSLLTGEWGRVDVAEISTRSWLGFAYLVIIGSWVGFVAYTWLLRVASTPLVSTYAYVNPLIAIFAGYFLAREPLTPRLLAAALTIIGAVALITLTWVVSRKNTVIATVTSLEER